MVEQDMADEFNAEAVGIEQQLLEGGEDVRPGGELVQVDTAWAMGIDDEENGT
jgi:hypothetical protein